MCVCVRVFLKKITGKNKEPSCILIAKNNAQTIPQNWHVEEHFFKYEHTHLQLSFQTVTFTS